MPGMRWTTKINYQLVIGWKVGGSIMQIKLQWSVTIFQGVRWRFGEREIDSKDLPKNEAKKSNPMRIQKIIISGGDFFQSSKYWNILPRNGTLSYQVAMSDDCSPRHTPSTTISAAVPRKAAEGGEICRIFSGNPHVLGDIFLGNVQKFTEEISTNCWVCRYFQRSVMVSTSERTLQGGKNSIGKKRITSVHSWSLTDHDSEPKKFQVSCLSQNFHICFPWYKPLNMSATQTLRVLTLTLRRCNLKRVSPTTKLRFDTLWSSTWATLHRGGQWGSPTMGTKLGSKTGFQ